MTLTDFNAVFENKGGVYVNDTSNNAGPYQAIKALTSTVIASMTCAKITGTLTSISVAAGDFLPFPGGATNLTLTSGTCILINQ